MTYIRRLYRLIAQLLASAGVVTANSVKIIGMEHG